MDKEWLAKFRQLGDRCLGRTQSRKSDGRQRTGNRSLYDSRKAVAEIRMTRTYQFPAGEECRSQQAVLAGAQVLWGPDLQLDRPTHSKGMKQKLN